MASRKQKRSNESDARAWGVSISGRFTYAKPQAAKQYDDIPPHALPHLGLRCLLRHRLSGLPPRAEEQPVDEYLVSHCLVHVLRLVESVVLAAPLWHVGHRLL